MQYLRGVELKKGRENEQAESRHNEHCCMETTLFCLDLNTSL